MIVLGLTWNHDSHAVLIKDGRVIAAVGEERITRKKNHYGFPYEAIKDVIKIGKISPSEIDEVAVSNLYPPHGYLTKTWFNKNINYDLTNIVPLKIRIIILFDFIKNLISKKNEDSDIRNYFIKLALNELGIKNKVSFYDHHLCHAASVFYTNKTKKSLIFVVDQFGDDKCVSVWMGNHNEIKLLKSYDDEMSPGAFYSEITHFLGFKRHRHEGKITGLAALGDPYKLSSNLEKVLKFDEINFSQIRPEKLSFFQYLIILILNLFSDKVYQSNFKAYNNYFQSIFKGHNKEDIAAAAQKVLEDFCVNLVNSHLPEEMVDISLAGGIFANVRVNQKIREIKSVNNVFVHQNMGDGGLAMGAAILKSIDNNFEIRNLDNVYLGGENSKEETKIILDAYGLQYEELTNPSTKLAEILADSKILGIVIGRMEYGPRSLCNRSIICEAKDENINKTLNERLNRTEFMPFAPCMTDDAAHKVLVNFRTDHVAAQFMTMTYDIRPEYVERIPAVVHVDGTARPQVVTRDSNPLMYEILTKYEKLTHRPALINTSFNAHEEPIVYSVNDALRALSSGSVDLLYINGYLVKNTAYFA